MPAPRQTDGVPAVIGLTGQVAAGKSAALDALGRLGAETLSTDHLTHELLASDELRDLLVARWGPEVAPQGRVDRRRVGEIVFERPDELKWLEGELHPRVARRVIEWRHGLAPDIDLAVVEVPLLFEAGMESFFDATLVVAASDPLRAERAGARGTEALDERAGRQLSQEEKASRATFVVENDGSIEDLEAALADLRPRLVAAAGGDGAGG